MTDRSVSKQLCNCLENECHAAPGWTCRKKALTSKKITRWQHFQMDRMQPMLPVGTRAATASVQCQPTGEVYVLASDHDAEIHRLRAALEQIEHVAINSGVLTSIPKIARLAHEALSGDSSAPETPNLSIDLKSFPIPWRIERGNSPIADTGDYDGVTSINAANGAEVVVVWNASDEQEEAFERIVRSVNGSAPETKSDDARDAERYRYLRERSMFDRYTVREYLTSQGYRHMHGDRLDRELDECIGLPPAQETGKDECQHDLLKPKSTIAVDPADAFHAWCTVCKHDFRTRAPLEVSEPLNLACEGFVPDPHSRFCDRCGYPQHDHHRPSQKASEDRRPTGQCSWGCYYNAEEKLVRDPACTVHGAS